MYKVFYGLIMIIWVLDILDMPFMGFLDTTIPINCLAWILIFLFLPEVDD